MADEPIKLFSSRAERYPETTAADATLTVGRAALAAIPVIGGSLTEVLSYVLAPAVARRRDTWFKELADALEDAERKIDGFHIENLSENEAFVSAVIEATRSAVSTHKDEKREALRNGLLHIAMHRSTDEDQQQTFLRFIDELTVWHLRFLVLFQDPPRLIQQKGLQLNWGVGSTSRMLEEVYPDLQGKRTLYDQLAIELHARGLLDGGSFLHAMVSPTGMTAKRTTALGDEFIQFIADPLGEGLA